MIITNYQDENLKEKSESVYKKLIESVHSGIFIHQNGKICFVNPRMIKIMGYSKQELMGRNIWDFARLDDREKIKKLATKKLKGMTEGTHYEFRIVKKNGEVAWLDMWLSITDYQYKPAIIGNILDSTKRKLMENKLKKSEKEYRELSELSGDGIIQMDSQGKIVTANSIIYKSTGYSKRELIGEDILNFISGESIEQITKDIELLNLSKEKNLKKLYEMVIITKSGNKIPVEVLLTTITEKGEIKGFHAVVRDITQRKIIEKRINELKRSAGFYLDLMSHDINNINQVIVGYTDLQDKNTLNDKEKKYLSEIKNSTIRISNLIKNVNILTKLVKEEKKIKLTKKDVYETVKDAERKIFEIYPNKKIILQIEEKNCFVKADNLIFNLFFNLLLNSVQNDNHKIVKIDINTKEFSKDKNHYWKIEILDRGCGIHNDVKKQIFTRYEDILSNKDSLGSGLGLTLVKAIVDRYNGEILIENRVKSDYKKGTKLNITLQKW